MAADGEGNGTQAAAARAESAYESKGEIRERIASNWDLAVHTEALQELAAEGREIAGAIIAVGVEVCWLLDRDERS